MNFIQIKRIPAENDFIISNPLYIFGNLQDFFIPSHMKIIDIYELLWLIYKFHGYDGIFYVDPHYDLFTLDEESISFLKLSNHIPQRNEIDLEQFGWKTDPFWGDLESEEENQAAQQGGTTNYRVSDDGKIRARIPLNFDLIETIELLFNNYLSNRFVFIFTQSEQIFQGNFRVNFDRWFSHFLDDHEKHLRSQFVFLFHSTKSMEEIKRWLAHFEIHALRIDNNSCIKIGFPYDDEIRRAIHYVRLMNRKKLDFLNLNDMLYALTSQNLPLHQILNNLNRVPEITRDNIKAFFKIQDMESPEKKLEEMEGLDQVKLQLDKIWALVENDVRQGKKHSFHMIFEGNPGTGKTTVARLVGQIFKTKNILKRGHFVEVTGSQLLGVNPGDSKDKTLEVLNHALDGILFLDEAYSLIPGEEEDNSITEVAVDTLTGFMESNKERLVVIAAGYPKDMQKFLDSNEGLAGRFRYRIHFDDYDPKTLKKIFDKNNQYKMSRALEEKVQEIFEWAYESRGKGFGNARFALNLLQKIESNFLLRCKNEKISIHEAEMDVVDIPDEFGLIKKGPEFIESALDELKDLENLNEVKKVLEKFRDDILFSRFITGKIRKLKKLNFVFMGNPGTGKTTVAYKMGKILFNLGILPSPEVIKVGAEDLIKGYVGQTGRNVKKIFRQAKGKVLFIDEAHNLIPYLPGTKTDFQGSVINTMVNLLTDPEYDGNMAVILAGYPEEMKRLIKTDLGLDRRFPYKILFENFSDETLLQIFLNELKRRGYKYEAGVPQKALEYFSKIPRNESFSNADIVVGANGLIARLERNLRQRCLQKYRKGQSIEENEYQTIYLKDFEGIL